MQPQLHIFSHLVDPGSLVHGKPPLRGTFLRQPAIRPDRAVTQGRVQARAMQAGLHAPEILQAAGEGSRLCVRLPAAYAAATTTPSPPQGDHPKGPNALPQAPSRPPRPRRPQGVVLLPRIVAVVLLLATLGGALAGCGSSHSAGTAADPAAAVPASASLYLGATVRPEGSQKADALADGHALTQQADPYLRLLALLQTPGAPALSFTRDVAPWLGTRAGLFLSAAGTSSAQTGQLLSLLQQGLLGSSTSTGSFPYGSAAGGGQGAIVLDTTDSAKARAFLSTQATRAGAHPATYRGVSYESGPGGVASGLIDRFVVIGSESGLRSVIDTTLGGPALAHASGYSKLLAVAPAGAIAHVYSNPAAVGAATRAARSQAPDLVTLLAGAHETEISLVPSAASLAIDADILGGGPAAAPGGLLAAGADGAQAFAELPGDSWLALGLGHAGSSIGEDVRGLRALASLTGTLGGSSAEGTTAAPISLKGLLEGLLKPLSLLGADSAQARRAFASWMGSAGVFASGAGLLELRAAVVIESKDPALSRAAVATLAAQLQKAGDSVQRASIPGAEAAVGARITGLPIVLDIAAGRDSSGHTKFVLGLGEQSVVSALNPSSVLSGAASTKAAAAALGEGIQPNLTFDVPTLVSLLEGVGLSEDPTLSQVLPYLRRLTTVAGGSHSLGGEVQRVRVVLGLRGASG